MPIYFLLSIWVLLSVGREPTPQAYFERGALFYNALTATGIGFQEKSDIPRLSEFVVTSGSRRYRHRIGERDPLLDNCLASRWNALFAKSNAALILDWSQPMQIRVSVL